MGDLAQLLPGIASVITALGGVYLGRLALKKGSPKERDDAARRVIDRILGDDDGDDNRDEARAEILKRLRELEGEGDDS